MFDVYEIYMFHFLKFVEFYKQWPKINSWNKMTDVVYLIILKTLTKVY